MNFLSNLRFHRNSVRIITSPPFIALGYAWFSKVCCFYSSFSFLKTLEDKNVEMYLILQIYVYLICHVMSSSKADKVYCPYHNAGPIYCYRDYLNPCFFSVLIKCTAQQLFSSNNIPLFSKEKHNPLFPRHECFLIEYFCVTLFTKYYNILSHIWRKTLGYFFENTYCDHKLSPQTHGSKGKENTTQSKIA